MLNKKAVAVLALLLCVVLIGACASPPPPELEAYVEEEELVEEYQEEPEVEEYNDNPALLGGLYFDIVEEFTVETITDLEHYPEYETGEGVSPPEYMGAQVLFIPITITNIEPDGDSDYRLIPEIRLRTHTGDLSIFEVVTLNGRELVGGQSLDQLPNYEGAYIQGYLAFDWIGYGEYTVEIMQGAVIGAEFIFDVNEDVVEIIEKPEPEEPPEPAQQQADAGGAQPAPAQEPPAAQQEPAPAQEQPAPTQEPPAQPAPQQQPPVQQPPVQQPPPATTGTVTGSEFEMEVIRLVNMQRAVEGLPPLTANAALMQGARIRAAELDTQFSHTRPNGTDWSTVLAEVGFTRSAGENILAGADSPSAAISRWMGSQGHRNNIMAARYNEIGVGAVMGSDGRWRWVQLFGGTGAAAAGGGQGQPAGQGSGGVTWVPSRAQYSISAPASGQLFPGDVLELTVVSSDPSIPFTVRWSSPRNNNNNYWSFRDGMLEIFDHLGPGTPSFSASATVFEGGNPVTELTVTLNFAQR